MALTVAYALSLAALFPVLLQLFAPTAASLAVVAGFRGPELCAWIGIASANRSTNATDDRKERIRRMGPLNVIRTNRFAAHGAIAL